MACKHDALYTDPQNKSLQEDEDIIRKYAFPTGDYGAELVVTGFDNASTRKKFKIHVDKDFAKTSMSLIEASKVDLEIIGLCKIPTTLGITPRISSSSFPAQGWVCIKVVNSGNREYNDCTAVARTDVREFTLYDWEEYERQRLAGKESRYGAEPHRYFHISTNGAKNLYTQITANIPVITISLKFGNHVLEKQLNIEEEDF